MSPEQQTYLENQKISVFASADSLNECRDIAAEILSDSPRSQIKQALDIYHNTLIDQLMKGLRKRLDS
ncbi:hypothetical protein [Alteromonas sp. RKMC-009]|uniref:hypothetical protein n=1 Tax=Alteromonas sp. RKMC-009 TaxID=2267264 RepID=UPI000E69388F|nr:hypothetical protein [Alteromonas sp. RKMC-009]AYA64301.1 hypothetical protein DS731_10000 [Alteromonas sp. RKMC-009]